MKHSSITLLAVVLISFGCSDSDEPLEGWKESEVEVVNEGAATGTTGQIVVGESATPMTATNIDTTTDLDMITDEQLGLENEGLARQDERSLADTLDPGSSARSTELETTPRGPGVAARPTPPVTRDPEPSPSPSPPAREPRPSEPREQEPSRTDTTDEAVDSPPPIVTPPLEPEPPAEEENEPAPPPTETTTTDTTDSSNRDEDPPRSSEPDDESEQRDEGDSR